MPDSGLGCASQAIHHGRDPGTRRRAPPNLDLLTVRELRVLNYLINKARGELDSLRERDLAPILPWLAANPYGRDDSKLLITP